MEVRKKTEELRKAKEDLNGQKHPLIDQSQTLRAKIDSQQNEVDAFKGKETKVETEIKINEERISQT